MNDLKRISVSGIDAEKFLQGQLCCDVRAITPGQSSLGAHCNAKGRVMSVFQISRHDDVFHLEMPSDVIEDAFIQLKKYAVFSNVKLDILPSTNTDANWHQHNIEAGIPRLYPQTIGQFLPHYLNLVKLGAVSFTKGCYTGQEIIARMQHRGKLKQQMQHLEFDLMLTLIPGETINDLGQVVDVVKIDNKQIALVIL
ncbi:MAG: folate-binding protein [Gammaproteobacteria bacterium]|nr:folate-binding protein [Gammaproteobacteria bacterium]